MCDYAQFNVHGLSSFDIQSGLLLTFRPMAKVESIMLCVMVETNGAHQVREKGPVKNENVNVSRGDRKVSE